MPKTMTLEGPRGIGKPITVKNFIETYNSLDGETSVFYKFGMSPQIWAGIAGLLVGAWFGGRR